MFFKKVLAFVLCSVAVTNGAFVDTLVKCHKDDGDCGASLITKMIKDIAGKGVPELEIPPIDPVQLKDIKANILNAVDIYLDEGTVKGIKNCHINSFRYKNCIRKQGSYDVKYLNFKMFNHAYSSPNTDKLVATLDLTCDLILKGKYKLASKSDVIKSLLGGEVHGDGIGKVKIEKLNIVVNLPYDLVLRDGDVFIHAKKKKLDYSFNILGRVTFAANNLFIGDKESSAQIIKMMNDNWKSVVSFIGKKFIDDIAVDKVFEFLDKFLNNVATKYYVIDDLAPLAKNS